MNLDRQVCSRARLSRDPRFDGKFFIGVRGSGVYCRPTCPAPTAKEKNCRYFPTAAAAAEAGFRPCLRCHPEGSPGTPAWSGTSNTVSRGLRLIAESGLEDGGVEGLADRLGVGSRHLRRLFLRHLGATPLGVARTRRLHFAKKLIDETSLPMNQIAFASGFGCVRRFNANFIKFYRRTPTQIRRLVRQKEVQPGNQYLFRLNFRPPYDWHGVLNFLAARATPGVEVVEADSYRRSICANGRAGFFEVSIDEVRHLLLVRIEIEEPRALFFVVERIRAMFDLNADWEAIEDSLGNDPVLGRYIRMQPGLRAPGCWDGFELAILTILGQQITLEAATTLIGRMAAVHGMPFRGSDGLRRLFPAPKVVAGARLTEIGIPAYEAKTIQSLARVVCDGKIRFSGVVDSEALQKQLQELLGIAERTAKYIAMRAMGEPDAFPTTDPGLLRAMNLREFSQLERRAEDWRPWRIYAAMYLWRSKLGTKSASAKAPLRIRCTPA